MLVRIDPRDYQAKVDLAKAALLEAESRSQAAQQVVPLTNDTTQSAVTAADAELADANAELERARLAYAQASGSDLAFAEANVAARQAANDRAQADLARMKPLVEKSEISSLQFDSYNAAARVAASELKAAQEKLASARQDAAIRKTALDAAQSRVGPLPGAACRPPSPTASRCPSAAPTPAPLPPPWPPPAPTWKPPSCS